MKRLSIVIPAFNEAQRLPMTVAAIHDAVAGASIDESHFEIIVCDNNSSDEMAEVAKSLGVVVVYEPINQISRARNRGAAVAKGEWLLFVDADTWPDQALMQDTIAVMEDGGYIGCGTTIEVIDGTLFNKLRMERLNPLFRLFNWSGGAYLLCRRSAFEAIGGFSTQLFAYEEIDFVGRLKRYGRQHGLRFKVLHEHPVKTSGRKGDYSLHAIGRVFVSSFAALFLLIGYYVLPRKWIESAGTKFLGYWYSRDG